MSIQIITNTIGEPQRRRWTADAVIAGIGDRQGDYEIRINGSDGHSPFRIQVTGPEGFFEHSFEGQWRDRNFIENYFEQVIPRLVPASVRILCDECVQSGLFVPMEVGMLIYVGGSPYNDAHTCGAHRRIWHRWVGYVSGNPSGCGENVFRPVCSQCGETMYIEFADSQGNLRTRCHACNHYEQGNP